MSFSLILEITGEQGIEVTLFGPRQLWRTGKSAIFPVRFYSKERFSAIALIDPQNLTWDKYAFPPGHKP